MPYQGCLSSGDRLPIAVSKQEISTLGTSYSRGKVLALHGWGQLVNASCPSYRLLFSSCGRKSLGRLIFVSTSQTAEVQLLLPASYVEDTLVSGKLLFQSSLGRIRQRLGVPFDVTHCRIIILSTERGYNWDGELTGEDLVCFFYSYIIINVQCLGGYL